MLDTDRPGSKQANKQAAKLEAAMTHYIYMHILDTHIYTYILRYCWPFFFSIIRRREFGSR